jgi:two-component system OmpR family sensor kinase
MARAMAEADMAEADVAEGTDLAASSAPGSRRWSPFGAGKRLSDRTPLRTKLITAVLVLVMLALVAISFSSVYVLRSYLTTQNDGPVRSAYQSLIQALEGPVTFKSVNTLGQLPGNFANVYAGLQQYGAKLNPPAPTGGIIGGGGNPLQMSVPSVPSTQAWATANAGKFMTLPAQSGANTWRVIVAPYSGNGLSGTIVVGYDLGNINAEILQLIKIDVIVSAAIIVVLAAVAIAVVRANLRPLNDIELSAGQIAKGHLDHRVPEGDPRTEIGSLGRSLNAMLSQIERAFHAQGRAEQAAHESEERMRRFVADAAHELRTPLTTIRGFAAHYRQRGGASSVRPEEQEPNSSFRTEAADSGPSTASPVAVRQDGMSPEDLDHLVGRVEAEAARMGLLVEDLLTLARLDQQRPLAKAPVDLLTLAVDAVQDARIVSPGRPIDLIVAPGTAFLVDGDEPRLRQVMANLVNNAITHTPAGTPVRVKIARGTLEAQPAHGTGSAGGPAEQDGWGGSASAADASRAPDEEVPAIVLDVDDDGPGMSAEQAQRVFERFYRADAARNRASGGTGLGLAIVAGLVSAHGGTVSVRTAPGQGADFQVKLPLSPDAQGVDDADDDVPI